MNDVGLVTQHVPPVQMSARIVPGSEQSDPVLPPQQSLVDMWAAQAISGCATPRRAAEMTKMTMRRRNMR